MASIKFRLLGKTTPVNIYVRLSLSRGEDYERKTGYSINPKNWSKPKAMPMANSPELKNLRTDLENLKAKLSESLNRATRKKIVINSAWLQNEINTIHGLTQPTENDFLVNHTQNIIDNAGNRKKANNQIGLSLNRIKSYKTFKNTVIRFQDEVNKGKSFTVKDVDFAFSETFKDWLFDKGYSINYVGKNIDNLKTVCYDAEKRSIEVSNQLKLISGFSEQKQADEIIILSEAEQITIAEIELEREALNNARKWLLLGCQLGQRFSDLIRIDEGMIKPVNDIRVIELKQKKTGKIVVIPLLPKAIEIVENGMPYPISLQKFNKYIKEICKMAGIDEITKGSKRIPSKNKTRNTPKTKGLYPKYELIGSHVCRRSFASNFYGKIPTPVLIGITGHGTEKMFLKYIGRTSYDNAHQMMEYFSKMQNT